MLLKRAAALFAGLAACIFLVNYSIAEKKNVAIEPVGADHRDAPVIDEDAAADINDVYAFVNPNNGKTVLAVTVNPFTMPGIPTAFSADVLYQIKIDNTGDAIEDLVIQATFTKLHQVSETDPTLVQEFKIVGPEKPKKTGAVNQLIKSKSAPIEGPANGTVFTSGDIDIFAGRREDPFFLDFVWVTRQLGLAAGGPLQRAPGIDFFAGANVGVLAIQLPPAKLTGGSTNIIKVWASTSRANATKRSNKADDKNSTSYVQVERMGLPLINTVLIQDADLKDKFNKSIPSEDGNDSLPFKAKAIANLSKLSDAATAAAQVDVLFPDVLTLDTTNVAGFSALNGRRPEDDVVDIELNLLSKGALTSDGVNANDKPFLIDFPFFAPENPASATVPARN